MWEDADPDFTTTLNVAGHCLAGALYLAAGNALVLQALEAVIAKRYIVATSGNAFVFTNTHLAVSNFFRK